MLLPIAHRGSWYPNKNQQNTPDALLKAASAGYGLETDVRQDSRRLYIQHDPITCNHDIVGCLITNALPAFEKTPLICWNLKEETAESLLIDFIVDHQLVHKSVVFDWELYKRNGKPITDVFGLFGIKVLHRVSDRAENTSPGLPGGRWVDQWDSDWVTKPWLLQMIDDGPLYVVSSELHGRTIDLAKWKEWLTADGICTDHPVFLEMFMNGDLDMPADAWWLKP